MLIYWYNITPNKFKVKMDTEKQKLLIQYLISSEPTFSICQGILKPEYFNPEFKNTIRFIKKYYDQYNAIPNIDQIKAETKQSFVKKDITPDQIKYCTTEIESFCRQQALINAIYSSPKLIEEGDYGQLETSIREAILISLSKNLGTKYFDDPLKRLNSMLQDDPTEPTGWKKLDDALFGGITRQELLLFSANSGGGKSICLANLALNFTKRGRNVLIISLELSENIISQRFDTMITGIGKRDWRNNVSEIANKVILFGRTAGILDLKHMSSGTTSSDIRAYLKEYYLYNKFYPDMLIVDYIDNMAPNEYVSADNIWQRDKNCSEQLRQIGVDYNMFIATASQLNREAVKATQHDHTHIAGGISKINVADVYISLKMSDQQKAAGEIWMSLQKTRNSDGVGMNILMKWDKKRLLITDIEESNILSNTKRTIKTSEYKNDPIPTGNDLEKMISDFTE